MFQYFNMKPRLPSEDNEEKLDTEALLQNNESPSLRWSNKPASRTTVPLLIVFTSLLCLALGIFLGKSWPTNMNLKCIAHTAESSALLDDIEINYHTVRYNGSFMRENIYRREASPEVDAAWEALGINYRAVRIPESRAREAHLRHDQVKINPKYGGGYPANVEGLHHLHCLNLLRQSLWYNFDYYHAKKEGAFVNDDNILQVHVSHCMDIIRQQLMCTVDIGVLGQVWWNPEYATAFVDFNTQHKCRNFDTIRQWAEDHQLPAETPSDFLQPPAPGDMIYPEIP